MVGGFKWSSWGSAYLCLAVCLSVYLSVCLSVHLSVYLSIYSFLNLVLSRSIS
jgi:hypothetical protein